MSENRIRYLRKLRKLTQVELAERLGVPHSAIQKLETGIVDLDTKWMKQLSIALDVKPYELLPLEWQTEEITPEEREILRMIRNQPHLKRQIIAIYLRRKIVRQILSNRHSHRLKQIQMEDKI